MAAYTLERQHSPNQSSRAHYGYPPEPTGITIHWWGSTGQKHANVADYLARPNGNTSAHLVCSAGLVHSPRPRQPRSLARRFDPRQRLDHRD